MELYEHYLRLFIAFPLVIFLIYFSLRFLLPRLLPTPGLMGKRLAVVERVALNARTFLLVVKVGREYLLLALTASGVTLLKNLGECWEEESFQEGPGLAQKLPEPFSFARVLRQAGQKSATGLAKGPFKMMLQKILQKGEKSKMEAHIEEDSGNISRK